MTLVFISTTIDKKFNEQLNFANDLEQYKRLPQRLCAIKAILVISSGFKPNVPEATI